MYLWQWYLGTYASWPRLPGVGRNFEVAGIGHHDPPSRACPLSFSLTVRLIYNPSSAAFLWAPHSEYCNSPSSSLLVHEKPTRGAATSIRTSQDTVYNLQRAYPLQQTLDNILGTAAAPTAAPYRRSPESCHPVSANASATAAASSET